MEVMLFNLTVGEGAQGATEWIIRRNGSGGKRGRRGGDQREGRWREKDVLVNTVGRSGMKRVQEGRGGRSWISISLFERLLLAD